MQRVALSQVLAYRRFMILEGELLLSIGTPQEKIARKKLISAGQELVEKYDSTGYIVWVMEQSLKIEQVGWRDWLKTPAARSGYKDTSVSDLIKKY